MKSVREIIEEACHRINLVPRRQAPAGDQLENGYRLLKGIVTKYNNDNLLAWTQNSIIVPNNEYIHIYDESDTLKGENNLYFSTVDEMNAYELTQEDSENDVWATVDGRPGVIWRVMPVSTQEGTIYTWYGFPARPPYPQRYQRILQYRAMFNFQVTDMMKINSLYLVTPNKQLHAKLEYVAPADFDKYTVTAPVFTYTQKSEGEWLIQIKPSVAKMQYDIKINYNEGIEFDLNTELYIPDNYVELLIVALAHKLALMYPRLDDAQMQRLENEVRVLIDNVQTPKAVDRMIERSEYFYGDRNMSQSELLGGYGIL